MVKEILDGDFEAQVLSSDKPVLLDFSAEWCGPCRQLAPILDTVASEIGDRVTILKMDVDKSPETPTKFNVRGIPTMILFKAGAVVDSKVGVSDKAALITWIDEKLA